MQSDRLLSAIRAYIAEHGYPPTTRELCALCGLSSTSVAAYQLRVLEREKKIKVTRGTSRGIKVLAE